MENGKVLRLEKKERIGSKEKGEGGGRCAVGLHGSLPTATAAVSFVDRMDCIESVQPLGGGDVDSGRKKKKKKQRGFSTT